ncbi:MAG: dienelactone hydrolase family protein [Actinomycetota bacterium]|nr:dienelactone hydrolase family protein [Actinomycetota bacterium]
MADPDDTPAIGSVSWQTIPGGELDLQAFVAEPARPVDGRALIVLHENPGITEWRQRETARMAADLRWTVVVMNAYSRLDGAPPPGPFDTQDERRRAAFLSMPDEQVARDLEVTANWVRARTGGRTPALLGFCSGGGQAIYAVSTRRGLAGCVVAIYGNIVLRGDLTEDREPLDRVPLARHIDCPVQLHIGTEDSEIPAKHVDRLEAELTRAHKTFEIHRYEGAGHVFADETHPNYDAAATAEMWPQVYAFLREHVS